MNINLNNINNISIQKYDEPIMNNNLYVANIPQKATKEDLEKTFGEFGEIDSIKLDEDENSSSKKEFINKEFGYVLFKIIIIFSLLSHTPLTHFSSSVK